jgi:hypothetical protein
VRANSSVGRATASHLVLLQEKFFNLHLEINNPGNPITVLEKIKNNLCINNLFIPNFLQNIFNSFIFIVIGIWLILEFENFLNLSFKTHVYSNVKSSYGWNRLCKSLYNIIRINFTYP